MAGTLHAAPNNFRTFEILIAAKYGQSNVKVEYNKPADSKKFPFGKLPCFETSDGKTLTGSHAIAKYVAQKSLQNPSGHAKDSHVIESEIVQWFQLVDNELVPNMLAWLLPCVSAVHYDKQHCEQAKSSTLHLLKILDDFLLTKTFLVGERLTLADVAVSCCLLPLFQHCLEPEQRRHFVNLTRWMETCLNQPQFKAVLGDHVTENFCKKTCQFDAQKFKQFQQESTAAETAHSGDKTSKKEEKGSKKEDKKKHAKEEKKEKKAEKPKEQEPEQAEEMDEAEQALAQEPKQNDPFVAMPKGTFNMDEFKRVYSNEDTVTKALPYFWQNFDKENYSIWYCEYKYADELTLTFMSCNLIAGMFQRLDKLRKNAFASMCLFGTDNNSTISGVWVWRGHELAFTLSDDWKIDYESYDWKKLDATSPETKTLVDEYFKWEGNFGGKKFNQGKIFK